MGKVNSNIKKISEKVFNEYETLFQSLADLEKMEKQKDREEYFKCGCFSEGMLVTNFHDEPDHFYFSYWRLGKSPRKMPLWVRIKYAIKLLFKGDIYEDEVILTRDETKRLKNWLHGCIAITEKEDGEKSV